MRRVRGGEAGISMSTTEIKYPEIEVELSGTDGNAFAILGQVTRALRRRGVAPLEIAEFTKEATSGDYDQILQTCMRWVQVS